MECIKRNLLLIVLCLISFIPSAFAATNRKVSKTNSFNWDPIINAIISVESGGDRLARSGNCVGAMQIAPILVEDCNKILQSQNKKKRYKLSDRYNVQKSREMFLLIQGKYNPTNNVEKAIRLWNGGVHYKKKSTQSYYKKVLKALYK